MTLFYMCREFLCETLKEAGVKTKPLTSMKRLRLSQEIRVAAVISESETFKRSGAKTRYVDNMGAQHKRLKVFDRDTVFSVIIGDADPVKVDRLFEAFLKLISGGLYIDENHVSVDVTDAEWVDDDDSILKSKIAVNAKVKFSGGVYRDTDLAHISGVEIIGVEREKE